MRHESRKHMLQRYAKERQRNCLAVPGAHPCVLVLDGLKPGFNIGKIFRSAEAFGAAAVHLVNIAPFDPAPAKGSFRKVPARFFERIDDSLALLLAEGYCCYLLEPGTGTPLPAASLPAKSAFILGHEEFGPSCNRERFPFLLPLAIPQCGKVQSLNVSVAAGIVLYEYARQHPVPT